MSRTPVLLLVSLIALAAAVVALPGFAADLLVRDPHAGPAVTPFEKSEQWGYLDRQGRVAIAPTYDIAQPFDAKGGAMVLDPKGWRCIDRHEAVLLRPFVYDNGPDYVVEGLARFVVGGRIGYFAEGCVVRVPATFDFGLPFSEGLAAVCQGCAIVAYGENHVVEGGTWGFIDRKGAVVIPLRFDGAESFEGGKAAVTLGGKAIAIDRGGAIVP